MSTAEQYATGLGMLLQEGLRRHNAGQLTAATQIYAEILKLEPRHADALHLLGMVAEAAGMHDRALELIDRAIDIQPAAPFYSNRGSILQAIGRHAEALSAYNLALRLDPSLAETHLNRGLLLALGQRFDLAEQAYREALRLKPELPAAWSNLGNALEAVGRRDEAIASYEQALRLKPDFAEASYNLANVMVSAERQDEAIPHFEQALMWKPDLAEAHCNLGNVLEKKRRLAEAELHQRRAIALRPHYAEAHYNLGNVLVDLKRYDEALESFRQALAADRNLARAHNNLATLLRYLERFEEALLEFAQVPPDDPIFIDASNNMGLTLLELGRHEEALDAIGRTLALKPDLAQAHCNRGAVLHALNRTAEARASYEQALALDPALAKARINLGLLQLVEGDLANGWRNYEARWQHAPLMPRGFSQPQWPAQPDQATPLNGQRILLHAEQGHGDTLHFVRYVPLVQAMGGRVVLEVQPRLVRLLRELPGVDAVVAAGDPLPEFDCHIPLLSLPLAFATTLANIPASVPYLRVPQPARERAAQISWSADRLRVGLLWSGNQTMRHDRGRYRSVPLSTYAPLWQVEGVQFYSLQVDEATAELAQAPGSIVDLAPHCDDMADTAAQIEQLDLVITVDTSIVHLAGALGVPTWVLMTSTPDWRWLEQREDTPWYPTVRLYRAPAPAAWQPVVERIRGDLARLAATRR